jgi:hypothetical protein
VPRPLFVKRLRAPERAASNQNAVTSATADQYGVVKISDLQMPAP